MAAGIVEPAPLYTIGHGTAPIEDFIAQLRDAGVSSLVDVRRFPGSRRNPQYGSETLAHALREAGIAYRHDPDLGGRRRASADSPNVGLRHEAFRAYADYMATPPFHAAFATLLDEAAQQPTAIACSETVWWRCHRRLIADATVLLAHRPVLHLLGGARKPHIVTDSALVRGDDVVYEAVT